MDASSEAILKSFQGPHTRCRNAAYPRTEGKVERAHVADSEVDWAQPLPAYAPTQHSSPALIGQPWADLDISEGKFAFNALDGKVNRRSFMGEYGVDGAGRPMNPMGRTGLVGRGSLGRWGPNHAADPVVTRWKRDSTGAPEVDAGSGRPVLEFVGIERRDCGEWAIPGGMVDAGEEVSATLRREFGEESLRTLELDEAERKELEKEMSAFFEGGRLLYQGYVDDPRNTDSAWMETVAVNFHDDDGSSAGRFRLAAGDDAVNVRWIPVNKDIQLYASHKDFIQAACELHNAHW